MRRFFLRICAPAFSLKICLSLLVYFFCCLFQLNAQQNSFLDRVIEITQMSSVYRNNVDWDTLKPKVYAAVIQNEPDTLKALRPAIGFMLAALGDNHSFMIYKGAYFGRTGKLNTYNLLNEQTKEALKKEKDSPVRVAKLSKDVAYISVPAMSTPPKDGAEMAKNIGQKLRDSLCGLNLADLKGIIVDLRLNTGGNMYPMIGGLAPLLGDGDAGSFVRDGKVVDTWTIKKENVYFGKTPSTYINHPCKVNKKIKIALLTGPITSSAGEATVISFIGKKNTRIFGEPTAGLVTANQMMKLGDNIYYYVSVSTEADRKGKEYKSAILPDEEIIGGDNFEDLNNDQKIIASMKWLTNKDSLE